MEFLQIFDACGSAVPNKDPIVPVGDRALDWAGKYIIEIRPGFALDPDDGVLFLSSEGQMFTSNHSRI